MTKKTTQRTHACNGGIAYHQAHPKTLLYGAMRCDSFTATKQQQERRDIHFWYLPPLDICWNVLCLEPRYSCPSPWPPSRPPPPITLIFPVHAESATVYFALPVPVSTGPVPGNLIECSEFLPGVETAVRY